MVTFENHPLQHLRIDYIKDRGTLWYYMQAKQRPSFIMPLLKDIRELQQLVVDQVSKPHNPPIDYLVLASDTTGVFNLGGDLELFKACIETRDADRLMDYARACIDVLYPNAICLGQSVTTISLVAGQALGGGFEAALSSNVLIAERGTSMGFPEIMFNLFPGMGAFHLLSMRISSHAAARLMHSGSILSAEKLYEMGVVDVLTEPGHGREAVNNYIRRHKQSRNGHLHIQKVRSLCCALSYEELLETAHIWVDAALKLTRSDLRKMGKLVVAQKRLAARTGAKNPTSTQEAQLEPSFATSR